MAFTPNMADAARRNLAAANVLAPDNFQVAGYLFGIAAECAVKAMMLEGRMTPSLPDNREKDDPFYAHFPELRTRLRDVLQGRALAHLSRLVGDDSFMSQWAIEIRYAGKNQVESAWVEKWQKQAKTAVDLIGT